MKLAFRIGSIAGLLIPVLLYYRHITLAFICLFCAILCFTIWAILDRNAEKNKARPQESKGDRFTGVATDDNTRLIIKAISDETNGFVTVTDIVRNTNLPHKTINKTLDWLIMNNFAIQRKGCNGKVFILTTEGRSIFSQLINENIKKLST
jgi:predicted transcriptional regulator